MEQVLYYAVCTHVFPLPVPSSVRLPTGSGGKGVLSRDLRQPRFAPAAQIRPDLTQKLGAKTEEQKENRTKASGEKVAAYGVRYRTAYSILEYTITNE